jgi:uncharacterized membrane protein YvbJ
MVCPECGQENPDGAKYCSKCLANLVIGAGGYAVPQQQAPSEWRGRSAVHREDLTRKVQEKSHRIMVEWLVYGGIVLILVLVMVLSVTVWGNKMPDEVAGGFMSALNARDKTAMQGYVYSPEGAGNEAQIDELIRRMGTEGSFKGLVYSSSEQDFYLATVNLTGGVYSPGGASLDVPITADSKLFIGLESHEGHWYVDLTRLKIFP